MKWALLKNQITLGILLISDFDTLDQFIKEAGALLIQRGRMAAADEDIAEDAYCIF